jgi:DNA-binding transcriptional MocR family regulator
MSKIADIVAQISADIEAGRLAPGQRLPSIRTAQAHLGVSKNTVIEGYARLAAMGLVDPRRGAGVFVARRTATKTPPSPAPPPHLAEAVDRISLLNEQVDQTFQLRPGDGRPPQAWMKSALPSTLKGNILAHFDGDQTAYGRAFGHLPLREIIAARMRQIGIQAAPEQIVTTFGANHALDLVIRRFLEPGDTVLVDDPGYYPLIAKLKLARIDVIGVARDGDGPNLAQLEALARLHRPKMFFTQSTCHNPTGSSMSLPVAHGVLRVAAICAMIIIDNDPFTDLPGNTGTRLAALDQFNSVITISTYSKLLSASFRVGYMTCAPGIAREMAELKLVTTINSSRFSELIITELIRSRRYLRHLDQLACRIDEARAAYLLRVQAMGLTPAAQQEFGYYSFLRLPDRVDERALARSAAEAGIFLAPGRLFYCGDAAPFPAMRVNVARAGDARFYRFLARAIDHAD